METGRSWPLFCGGSPRGCPPPTAGARRARLQPADVGLEGGQRPRTPGLRRQEVAQLAGMSVDYYIRLEQGRGPRPSRQMIAAIARALRLSDDERAYLHHL